MLDKNIWEFIFSYLPADDLAHMRRTNQRFSEIASTGRLWRELCIVYYGSIIHTDEALQYFYATATKQYIESHPLARLRHDEERMKKTIRLAMLKSVAQTFLTFGFIGVFMGVLLSVVISIIHGIQQAIWAIYILVGGIVFVSIVVVMIFVWKERARAFEMEYERPLNEKWWNGLV